MYMGKILIQTIGTIQIKMDTKDDVYFDAKEPHVSFVRHGQEIMPHVMLSEIDNLVGTGDSDLQAAIHYVRKNKTELKNLYNQYNR